MSAHAEVLAEKGPAVQLIRVLPSVMPSSVPSVVPSLLHTARLTKLPAASWDEIRTYPSDLVKTPGDRRCRGVSGLHTLGFGESLSV
jgi:hypothetical protein